MRIDRCVCTGRFFESLLSQAKAEGLSLTQLMHTTGAGRNCGSCRVYLCRAHRTGQAVFRELLEPQDEPGMDALSEETRSVLPKGRQRGRAPDPSTSPPRTVDAKPS